MDCLCGIGYLFKSTNRTISFFNSSSIKQFENQLGGHGQFIFHSKTEVNTALHTFFSHAKDTPEYFLKYCYYQQDHLFNASNIQALKGKNNEQLLEQYKETTIHGFSALGAAALARSLSNYNQKSLITALLKLGFIPTDEDKTIIQVKFNNTLATKHKAIAPFLLCTTHTQKNIFTTLPHEIKKIIMKNVIDIEKNQLTNDFYPF